MLEHRLEPEPAGYARLVKEDEFFFFFLNFY